MKSDSDIREDVFREMIQNGTLRDNHDPVEGIPLEDVRNALVNRFASKMNEELHEPFIRARIKGDSTEGIVNVVIERFVVLINTTLEDMYMSGIKKIDLTKHLRSKLDEIYI